MYASHIASKCKGQKAVEPDISRVWCKLGIFCWKTGSNWIISKSLQLEAEANGDNGDFFKERCFDTTNDITDELDNIDNAEDDEQVMLNALNAISRNVTTGAPTTQRQRKAEQQKKSCY